VSVWSSLKPTLHSVDANKFDIKSQPNNIESAKLTLIVYFSLSWTKAKVNVRLVKQLIRVGLTDVDYFFKPYFAKHNHNQQNISLYTQFCHHNANKQINTSNQTQTG